MKDKESGAWLTAAMTVPLAQAASGKAWPVVLAVLAIALPIGLWRKTANAPAWLCGLQWLGTIALLGVFLDWTHTCWPEWGTEYTVPLVLLILAERSAEMGRDKASRAASVLRFGIYGVFVIILVSGLKEVWLPNLQPKWAMPPAELAIVCLLPLLGSQEHEHVRTGIWIASAALVCAIVGVGVQGTGGDFYTLSRSLSYLGTAQRFESLAAAAMTLGYFSLLSFLLCRAGEYWKDMDKGNQKTGIRIAAVTAFIVYIMNLPVNGWIVVALMLILYRLLPLWIKIKNFKKGVDK